MTIDPFYIPPVELPTGGYGDAEIEYFDVPQNALASFEWVPRLGRQSHIDGLRFVTSISPKRIAHQQRCVRSWQDIGGEVIAYQPPGEITALRSQFPGVVFRETPEAIENRVLLRAVAKEALRGDVLVINSDIEIVGSQSQFVADWLGGNDVRLGFRWNYSAPDVAELELWGIDVFRITAAMVPHIDDAFCRLGWPGWDWWLPSHLMQCGFGVTPVDSPQFLHQWHALNWHEPSSLAEQVRICRKYNFDHDTMRRVAEQGRQYRRVLVV